jgi:chemotaxis protein MotA
MISAVGLLVVVISVVGGFTIAGGKLLALFHLSEIMVVAGTALGTVLISTPAPTLKTLGPQILAVVKPSQFNKALYLDALKLLNELFQMAQRVGLVAIE